MSKPFHTTRVQAFASSTEGGPPDGMILELVAEYYPDNVEVQRLHGDDEMVEVVMDILELVRTRDVEQENAGTDKGGRGGFLYALVSGALLGTFLGGDSGDCE